MNRGGHWNETKHRHLKAIITLSVCISTSLVFAKQQKNNNE